MGRELSTLISLDVTSTIIYKTKHKPDRPFYKIWASTETTQCRWEQSPLHYDDVTMSAMASQITSLTIVSIVYSGADQRKHQSSASLAFVRGIHRWPVNSPHKWPVTRKCSHLMTSSWVSIELIRWLSQQQERSTTFDITCWSLFSHFDKNFRFTHNKSVQQLDFHISKLPFLSFSKVSLWLLRSDWLHQQIFPTMAEVHPWWNRIGPPKVHLLTWSDLSPKMEK